MQIKQYLAAAVTLALAVGQNATTPDLATALNTTDSLSSLNTLLGQHPTLLSTLANATNITVLAPSNQAFQALQQTQTFRANANNSGFITALLSYHVLNGTVYSQNITATPNFVPTLLTNETYTNVTGGQVVGARLTGDGDNAAPVFVSGLGEVANVTQADVAVSNGVVHIIDTVLTIPRNVSSTAVDTGLTALAGAMVATNLTETVDTTPDITVFAPLNSAFEDIASSLGNLTAEQARAILTYHVINGTVAYSNLIANGSSIETASGQSVNITIVDGEVFVNSARVVATDILVANGVVHVIDSVLNPNSTQAPNPDDDNAVPAYSGASSGNVAYTSYVTATTTMPIPTTDAVASGYTPAASNALSSASRSAHDAASSSSSAGAAKMTGAIGAAALFGGAAYFANI